MKWFWLLNRYKHFLFAIPVGLIFTVLCALGLAAGMEFKDMRWEDKWDWIDFWCTVAGGLVGLIILIIIILIIC